jgi:tRNA A37 threonylcarbamoyltransferase TsaD
MKFPYLSLLATGGHTEIVLNRGIGLHTVLGMTIDIAIGNCIDKASNLFKMHDKKLKDKAAIKEFVSDYNKKNKDKIPDNYFEFLDNDSIHRGKFVEMLAKYGDPSEREFPLGFKN